MGRPIEWPDPQTALAERIQTALELDNNLSLSSLGDKYFDGASGQTVSRTLAGVREPTAKELEKIIVLSGIDANWILTGKEISKKNNAPRPDSGDASKDATSLDPDPADASFVQLIALLTELHMEAKTSPVKRAEWAAVLRDFVRTAEKSLRAG